MTPYMYVLPDKTPIRYMQTDSLQTASYVLSLTV